MKLKKITTAVALLGLGAFVAAPAAFAADAQYYVGASVGQAKAKGFCTFSTAIGATSCDDKDTGFKFFGGYQFDKNWAVEATYMDMGDAIGTAVGGSATLKTTGWGLAGVGTMPVSDAFSVFGKLGFLRSEAKLNVTGNPEFKGAGSTANIGFGASYNFTKTVALRAEWERASKVTISDIGPPVVNYNVNTDFLSAGIVVKF